MQKIHDLQPLLLFSALWWLFSQFSAMTKDVSLVLILLQVRFLEDTVFHETGCASCFVSRRISSTIGMKKKLSSRFRVACLRRHSAFLFRQFCWRWTNEKSVFFFFFVEVDGVDCTVDSKSVKQNTILPQPKKIQCHSHLARS